MSSPQDERGFIDPILIGRLQNFGVGPALETEVTWVAESLWIHGERFDLNEEKRREPLYSRMFNTMPTMTQHLAPGQATGLPRLPTFIEKDFAKKIKRVDGFFVVSCIDVLDQRHVNKQEFHIFTGYDEQPPWVHISIGELRVGELTYKTLDS